MLKFGVAVFGIVRIAPACTDYYMCQRASRRFFLYPLTFRFLCSDSRPFSLSSTLPFAAATSVDWIDIMLRPAIVSPSQSSAATVKQEEFTTPARTDGVQPVIQTELQKVDKNGEGPNHVTPLDPQKETVGEAIRATVTSSPTTDEKAGGKQVRFDGTNKKEVKEEPRDSPPAPSSPTQQKSKRGLVSRRGGRYSASRSPPEAVTEYKTYRSPSRKAHDEVPSLCSSQGDGKSGSKRSATAPASSISCNPSESEASPLANSASAAERSPMKQDDKTKVCSYLFPVFHSWIILNLSNVLLSPCPSVVVHDTTQKRSRWKWIPNTSNAR